MLGNSHECHSRKDGPKISTLKSCCLALKIYSDLNKKSNPVQMKNLKHLKIHYAFN